MIKDNGNPVSIAKKAEKLAKKDNHPKTMKITTGFLSPGGTEKINVLNRVNEELRRRLPCYSIKNIGDITITPGFITVILTKKQDL